MCFSHQQWLLLFKPDRNTITLSVFKLTLKPHALGLHAYPPWMKGGFTQQYSKETSPMKTFASLTRTHSIGKGTDALEGTEGGLINDKSYCSFFFFFALLSKDRSSPKSTKFYPLPHFHLPYSPPSFKISPVVLVLMEETHYSHSGWTKTKCNKDSTPKAYFLVLL